jgi:Tol biopolymer transport system component
MLHQVASKGDKIAFASQQNGLFDICIINIDGRSVRFTYNSGNNESLVGLQTGDL